MAEACLELKSEAAHDKRQREAGGKINKEKFESRKKD